MREIELVINKESKNIRRAILYIGNKYLPWRLKGFLDHTNLEELIVTGCVSYKHIEEMMEEIKNEAECGKRCIPEKFEFRRVGELSPLKEEFALVFEGLDDSRDILILLRLNPTYLYGEISEDGLSAFGIWEVFRKCSRHILIKTMRAQEEPQIFEWKKRDDNPTELSVILPMYNVEKYLDQCIQSLIAWKADYVEFLFVNDGSPDKAREIVLKYAEKDARIKLLDKENGGCASARQWGMESAKGRYIGFIDPDDFIDSSMYQKLLCAAMNGNYDISYCGYKEYYENTGETQAAVDVLGWPYDRGTCDQQKIWELSLFARVAIWRGIYKRELLNANGIHFYTDLKRFDDLPFKIETFVSAKSVVAVNEHLYYYRLARPGQDVSADDERLYVHFPIFNYLNSSIGEKKNAKLLDYLQMCKVQTHRYALEKIRAEYMKEYMYQAKCDLKTTGSFWRSVFLTKRMLGRHSMLFFLAIMFGDSHMIRRLRKHKAI